MKSLRLWILVGIFLVGSMTSAQAEIRQEQIQFKQGRARAVVTGRIKGSETVDYTVVARSGQSLTALFKPGNLSAYFNILPPDSDEAIFIGSTYGNRFEGKLSVDGTYRIRVYLMRNAARRDETSRYTLTIDLTDPARPPRLSFDRTLELSGISFRVSSENKGSITTIHIVPSGLEIDNTPIVRTLEGTITGAEVADINADGSPEIYVYVTSADSGSYGSLVAYSANRRKSLSEIYLPPLTLDEKTSAGYMGHDEFAVLEGVLGRRFPLYLDAVINAKPGGGMRQLQYKLISSEAGWALLLDRTVEY